MNDVLHAGFRSSTIQSRIRQMVLPRADHDRVFKRMLYELLFPTHAWDEQHNGTLPAALSTFSGMNPESAEFAVQSLSGIHFANIVRNGIEVVASRMAHRVMKQHPFEDQCKAWACGQAMAQWGEGREDFTLIRHEELLEEWTCRKTFENLFQRCGLAHDESAANYILNTKRNQTSYQQESDQQTDLSDRQQRWNFWTDQQKQTFRDLCGETMDFFGYSIPAT